MDANDQTALRLLAELLRLNSAGSSDNAAPAVRLTIRSATGEYIGEVPLSLKPAQSLTDAVSAVGDYAEAMPADFKAGQTPVPDLDPALIADIEDHFAAISPKDFLDDVFGSPDAEASLAAYERLVTGEWDGDL
ncbi:hypothetical protein [Streptomyces sp. Wb2n-11]|uniref:hypothetical protein n=1 Tax=Streptomyces sp. Wb2n-11 TaxID=1030533 RepID=UPI000B04799B|nr:hypothetical protein [Streptomyces sp. Wb2n-11]